MAKQPEIRYINAYVSGNVAYQEEPKPVRRKKRVILPKQKQQKETVIRVDPVAVTGIVVAAVLLVLLVVGFVRLQNARAEALALENYVTALQEQNLQLASKYSASYDLEEIREIALAMGMVPSSQVPHISAEVIVPQATPEPTAWENFWVFLTGLFA